MSARPLSPVSSLRRRAAVELAGLAAGAALYLGLLPARPPGLDVAMGLVGLGLVGVLVKRGGSRFWPAPVSPAAERRRRAVRDVALLTGSVLGLFALSAAWQAWPEVAGRLLRPRLLLALPLYLPWALLQQTLFQTYLLGRWRAFLPSPKLAALLNGIAFGAVHLPEWEVAALATLGGVAWSALYTRDRLLLPIAASHAGVGAAYYYWVADRDLLVPLLG
jgi:hypothetical protein